jgi:predicted nucleotidyltransferase
MNSFGLEADDTRTILSIFATHPAIESAILYGSRTTGRFKPGSDIDLVLTGKNLTDQIILDVRAELRDSNLPYMVDVIAENDIKDENLKREIDETGKMFYRQIPTEQDWQGFDCLDGKTAKKNFFGKNLEEAEKLFDIYYRESCYQDYIMWMPSVPFRYYVHAYMNYLLGNRSKGDADAALCFLGLVEWKIGLYQHQPERHTIWSRVKDIIAKHLFGLNEYNRNQMEHDQDDIRAVWERVKETIEYIRNNPDWFDWIESIYGNLEERAGRLLSWDATHKECV